MYDSQSLNSEFVNSTDNLSENFSDSSDKLSSENFIEEFSNTETESVDSSEYSTEEFDSLVEGFARKKKKA